MSAAVAGSTPINLRTTNSQPVRLGSSIQRVPNPRYSAVRYNHKPVISHEDDTTTSIVPGRKSGRIVLSLKDGDEEYQYDGGATQEEQTYILLPEKDGEGFVLERLADTQSFNLKSAPWESDASKLARQYPRLEDGEASSHEPYGDVQDAGVALDDDAEPDAGNPFDFRHYVHATDQPSPNLGRSQHAITSTPSVSQPVSRQATPLARPARKAGSAFAPQQKKAKPQTSPDTKRVKLSPEVYTKADVPTVRLDRKASVQVPRKQQATRSRAQVQDISLDDDGDLVLEGDGPHAADQSRRSLGLALTGQLGEGPISLRSAASSPATRVNSPMPSRPGRERDLDGDLEMDDPSPPDMVRHQRTRHSDDEDADQISDADAEGEADDDDVDVDALQLPSPAQEHRPSVSGTLVTADEDDDLERQMLMAMEQDDDDGAAPAKAESDEESEEE